MVTTRRYAITNLNPADDRRPGEVIEAVNQAITPSYHGNLAVASDPFPGLDRLIEVELELACGVAIARLTLYEAKVLAQQFPYVNVRALTFLRPADMWDDRDEVPNDPDLPKDLEKENLRLRRAISDLTLDKLILQEAARGNF